MEEQKDMQNQEQSAPETSQAQESVQPEQSQAAPVQTEQSAPQDSNAGASAENAKIWAIIGYIIPILFFIPLVMDDLKNNQFARFHANQQLTFLLFVVIGYIVSAILMVVLIGFLLYIIVMIASIVFFIMGIINAAKGEMKPLPIIGKITIIK